MADGSKLRICETDLLRVESKLNSAIRDRKQLRPADSAKDRLKGLHAFLEECDSKETLTKSKESGSMLRERDPFARDSRESEAASLQREQEYLSGLAQAKSSITSLQVELNSNRQDLEALRRVLDEERSNFKKKEQDYLAALSRREEEFSQEISGGLARQQEVIAKLLADKQNLSEQVASLMGQVRIADQKAHKLIQELKEKFKADMRESKEAWIAVEKAKRDKWKADKERELREITIKGLEPEVEKLLNKHKEEKQRMESEFQDNVRKEKTRLETDYHARMDEFKQQVLAENTNILRREKEFLQSHFESLSKETTSAALKQLEDAETRFKRELEEEREKRKKEAEYWEGRLSQNQKEHFESLHRLKAEFEVERKDWRLRLEEERNRARGMLGEEEKAIRKRIEDELQRDFKRKTDIAKQEAIRERDEQIQMIVDRLLKEKADEIDQAVQAERSRLKSRKNESEGLLEDLKTELTIYKERLLEQKSASSRQQDELSQKERTIESLLKENEDQRQQLFRLKARSKALEEDIEKDRVTMKAMEKAFSEQLELEKRKALEGRHEVHDLQAQHRQEKELLVRELEERQVHELESLERRIKGVLERKERELGQLREELGEKEQLCAKYEQLLERQRRELLGGL